MQRPRNVTVVEGHPIEIVCELIGDPKPEVISSVFSYFSLFPFEIGAISFKSLFFYTNLLLFKQLGTKTD